MLPILQGSLITVGPWFSTHGRKGLRVYPYQRGGVVKTASTSTTITLHDSGDIAASDYIMVCSVASYGEDNVWTPAVTKVALVTDVTSNVLTISGSGLTVAVGDYVLCLGVDTGGTAPNYDGSDITLYDDPVGTTASSYDYLVTGSSSGFIGWVNRGAVECDVLITDSSNTPLSVEIAKPVLQQRVDYAYRGTRPTLTIATGSITLPTAQAASEVIVAAETGTTDTLDTILGGVAGDRLLLTADSGDTITVAETGNIALISDTTAVMNGDEILELRFDGTNWVEVAFAAAGSGGVEDLGDLGDVDTTGAQADDNLQYDGAEWVPVASGGGGGLPGAPSTGDIAVYDGADWAAVSKAGTAYIPDAPPTTAGEIDDEFDTVGSIDSPWVEVDPTSHITASGIDAAGMYFDSEAATNWLGYVQPIPTSTDWSVTAKVMLSGSETNAGQNDIALAIYQSDYAAHESISLAQRWDSTDSYNRVNADGTHFHDLASVPSGPTGAIITPYIYFRIYYRASGTVLGYQYGYDGMTWITLKETTPGLTISHIGITAFNQTGNSTSRKRCLWFRSTSDGSKEPATLTGNRVTYWVE